MHEGLYRSDDLSNINFREYTPMVTRFIAQSYSGQDSGIDLHLDLDELLLDIDKAIPVSLLLNELVSNAYKHAFPDKATGNIWVTIRKLEGKAALSVKDDGVGVEDVKKIMSKGSLGLKLVESLIKQVKGEMNIANEKGFEISVEFPV